MFFRILGIFTAMLALFSAAPSMAHVSVQIDLSDQRMIVRSPSQNAYHVWKVSTARNGYRTPLGTFRPQFMKRMHYSTLYDNSPMPHSIFFRGNFAIHGTNYIKSLGRRASHGCVRLHPDHARMLFDLVRQAGMQNTTIRIVP